MKSNSLKKLQHPLFLIAVIIILCNDFYFKQAFGNFVTGKLSDFAGLFAFPFFFSCIFYPWKKVIHVVTFFLFLWWKSEFSQPFIDWANLIGIPMGRVVDYTDYIALVSIFFSYFCVSRKLNFRSYKPIYTTCIIIISSFSFMATTIAPKIALVYTDVDKTYTFDESKENLILKFDKLQKEKNKKVTSRNANFGKFEEESGVSFSQTGDTLAYVIDEEKIASFQIYPVSDTLTILKLLSIATYVNVFKLENNDSLIVHQDESAKYPYPVKYYTFIKSDTTKVNKLQKRALKKFEKRVIKKLK